MRSKSVRLLVWLGLVAFLVMGPALLVSAAAGEAPVAQEEAPYSLPDIVDDVEVPGWLQPFEPLARLPLWGQAAVLSAGVAGLLLVIPMVFKWVWNLGPDEVEKDPRNLRQISNDGNGEGSGRHEGPDT